MQKCNWSISFLLRYPMNDAVMHFDGFSVGVGARIKASFRFHHVYVSMNNLFACIKL